MAGGNHAGGWFRWRCFPCVYLIASWIGDGLSHVSSCYWTMWPYLILAHFKFVLDHMLGPCYSSSQFSIGTHVVLRSSHGSLLHWTMCLFLLVHLAFPYSTTHHGAIHLRFVFWFGHVAWRLSSRCRIFISPCLMHWFIQVSHFYLIMWHIQVPSRAQQSFHQKNNSRSSLLHILTT
jgi:hypothetical protein